MTGSKKNIVNAAEGILFWACVAGAIAVTSLGISLRWVV